MRTRYGALSLEDQLHLNGRYRQTNLIFAVVREWRWQEVPWTVGLWESRRERCCGMLSIYTGTPSPNDDISGCVR